MITLIYSGSFNPIHTGHALLASWVCQFCPEVEELWLTVTPRNPLKNEHTGITDAHRLHMASLTARPLTHVSVSDFEFTLPVPSYTYSTLCAMSRRWTDRQFKILIGSDNWLIFDKWKNHDKIISEFGVYIYPRPGYPVHEGTLPTGVRFLAEAPQTDISSTFIREGLRNNRDMNYFMPESVYEYVKQQGLYKPAPQ